MMTTIPSYYQYLNYLSLPELEQGLEQANKDLEQANNNVILAS